MEVVTTTNLLGERDGRFRPEASIHSRQLAENKRITKVGTTHRLLSDVEVNGFTGRRTIRFSIIITIEIIRLVTDRTDRGYP